MATVPLSPSLSDSLAAPRLGAHAAVEQGGGQNSSVWSMLLTGSLNGGSAQSIVRIWKIGLAESAIRLRELCRFAPIPACAV